VGHALNNDVIVHRFGALELYKEFTRSITNTPAALALTDGGYVTLALAVTNEAEAHRLSYGAGAFRVEDLQWAKFRLAVDANLPANTQVAFGLAGSPQDDPDNNANGVWFKILADNTVVVESDDGVTDVDDVATPMTAGLTFRTYLLNFRDGMFRKDPRLGGNEGGYRAILPSIENANGVIREVARSTQFTLDGATATLQPFVQIAKTSSTDWAHLFVQEIEIAVKRVSYAATAITTTTTTTTSTTTTTH
jgi:hypothetical protein